MLAFLQAEEFPALGPAPARAASGALPGDTLKQQADVRSLFGSGVTHPLRPSTLSRDVVHTRVAAADRTQCQAAVTMLRLSRSCLGTRLCDSRSGLGFVVRVATWVCIRVHPRSDKQHSFAVPCPCICKQLGRSSRHGAALESDSQYTSAVLAPPFFCKVLNQLYRARSSSSGSTESRWETALAAASWAANSPNRCSR